MNMRLLLNVSIEISLIIDPREDCFAKPFPSVPHAVYETLAIATVVHKRERRLENIPRLNERGKVHMPWY